MGQTIVITGGRGFVGQHLVAELNRELPDAQVIIWDLPQQDITKPATYTSSLQDTQPTWVIHLAALAAVGKSYQNPELVQHVNTEATKQLLETIVRVSPQTKVLVASTADIYGTAANTSHGQPLAELPLDQAKPQSPYGQSKWAMEKIIEASFNDRCIRVRPFPHIGPGQQTGFVTADFASQIAAIEAGQQSPVIKVGNLTAERDFTDVRDVVRAYCLLLTKGQVGEVYHVASGQATSIQHILDQLLKLTTATITVETDEARMRPSDVPRLVGDARKLHKATGWQPQISLSQSLQDILDDWRKRVLVR